MSKFKLHRPLDTSDPGFTIPGKTLRWVSGRVAENRANRPWMVIKKSDLTPELVKHIENSNPGAFAHGDTIRRGDLVLAACPTEMRDLMRKQLDELTRERSQVILRSQNIKDHNGSTAAQVFENSEHKVEQELIGRFKENKID